MLVEKRKIQNGILIIIAHNAQIFVLTFFLFGLFFLLVLFARLRVHYLCQEGQSLRINRSQ
jgi:hypothetical protein